MSHLPRVCVFSRINGLFHGVKKALPNTEVIYISPPAGSEALPEEDRSKVLDAEILLTEPLHIENHGLLYLPNLKWMQSTWAGVDSFMSALDTTKPYPSYQLTRAGTCFGPPMAEYVVAQIISSERNFKRMAEDQQIKKWDEDRSIYSGYRLLSQTTLGVLGLGKIGKDIAKAAKCFGMKVWGYGTQDGGPRTPCSDIDEYRGPSGIGELLSACDYVCSVLPSTPTTKGLLNGEVLSACKDKGAVFINIGRGDVISEDSIIEALTEGWISGAVLDVFEVEPLPESSLLWSHPAVTITPHVSGVSMGWQIEKLFVDNYNNYTEGKPLDNLVNWDAGY